MGPVEMPIQVTYAAVKFKFMVHITNKIHHISFILISQMQVVSGSGFFVPHQWSRRGGAYDGLGHLSNTLLWFPHIAWGIDFKHGGYIH